MRFLVVHSDRLEALFDAQLPRRLADEQEGVALAVARANRKPASCEHDALREVRKALPKLKFHRVEVSAAPETRQLKRPRRGRPGIGEQAPTEIVWTVSAPMEFDAAAVVRDRQHASCFPLVTDHLDTEGWDDARILAEYRHQGIVEGTTGFRWLKGPAAVSPMFLKTPTRMRALGLVMVLALMVRNYWQFRMRAEARATNETILHPFTDRPVTNLTAEMAMDHFAGLQSMQLRRDDVWSRVPQPIHATALQILRLLSVPPSIFWTPPRPKSRPLLI